MTSHPVPRHRPSASHAAPNRRIGRGSASLVVLALALAIAASGCGIAARVVTPPPASPQASVALSATLAALRNDVASVLGAARYQVQDARTPYRPGESPAVAAAPRLVLQAIVPEDADAGFVVLYEFPDPGTASAAARELAAYVGSGIGRVQFPTDARFTIRQVGAGLVFYSWSPGASADPKAEEGIATALASLGQGYSVGG